MRILLLGLIALAALVTGCNGSTVTAVQERGHEDLLCPAEIRVIALEANHYRAEGCGHARVYRCEEAVSGGIACTHG